MMAKDGGLKLDVEGFEDIDKELELLSKTQARGVVRRSLAMAARPVLAAARELVPEDQGDLKKSLRVSTRLSPRQRRRQRRERGAVEMFVGAGKNHAHLQEFGTQHHAPQPFMRPAWEAKKMEAFEILKKSLWQNILRRKELNAIKAAKEGEQ